MNRLLTVVNERKLLRNEYRRRLEDEYIQKQKDAENAVMEAEREKLRSQGVKVPKTEEEVKRMLRDRSRKKRDELQDKYQEMEQQNLDLNTASAPMLEDADLKLLSQTKVKLSQYDILKMYVGNASELDLKHRRSVMGKIQAQRAMHAKEVFLKELSALGRKMN